MCFLFSMVILYLRFGSRALQDNFVAELSTHYQNYILSLAGLDSQRLDHAWKYKKLHRIAVNSNT